MAWTTDDLLSSIKNRAMIPDASSGSLSPAALLNFASEELILRLAGAITSCREKYYETYVDTAVAAGVATFQIPTRALGSTVAAVQFLYQNRMRPLQPIDPASITNTDTALEPTHFYFQNNSVVIYPTPTNATGTVRLRYYQRPNRLEQTANCAQVTAIGTGNVTVAAAPSTWSTNTQVDFIPQTASQATPYGLNSVVTGVTGNVISFSALPAALAVGDWLALAEFTPIPEIPFEFQVVLAQAAACSALDAINDQPALQGASAKLDKYLEAAVKLLTPRDKAGKKIVVSGWRRY